MNLELRGKLPEAVGRNDSLSNLLLLFLPGRKIRFRVVAGLLCFTQKNVGDSFHRAGIKIQEGGDSSNCISRASTSVKPVT